MIIPILGEAPPRPPITTNLLKFYHFLTEIIPPVEEFKDGVVLLYPEPGNEELPSYLRSEIAQYLKDLHSMATQWNTAIIIPDIVQKQLLMSNRIYPGFVKFIRHKDKAGSAEPSIVDNAEGRLGFLEAEKLLLLEMLLGASPSRLNLEEVVHTLRRHKVFIVKFNYAPPGSRYRIIKFDSPSAINDEFKNFNDIRNLFYSNQDTDFTKDLEIWRDKTYMIIPPQGQDYDLFKIISSTVVTVGEEGDWTHQTLKDQWDELIASNMAYNIINDAFNTLKILYRRGFQAQTQQNLRTHSIGGIHWDFYRAHIMPVDCIVKCDLHDITTGTSVDNINVSNVYPPKPGESFAGNNYYIKEIKLKANKDDEESGSPGISLLLEKEEGGKIRLLELKLGQLGDFQPRRELYLAGIREGAMLPSFRGTVESNFEESFKRIVSGLSLRHPELGTERVVIERFERGELGGQQINFISGEVATNPLYFYNQLYYEPEAPTNSLSFELLPTWIHGDLNVGNIITTPTGDARIIDFARLVKEGPLEFDFAELEVDIRIRNLVAKCREMRDAKIDLQTIVREIFNFENGLLEVFSGRDEETLARVVREEFKPGFLVIAKIRKKLIETYNDLTGRPLSGSDVLVPYMTALYFESLAALNFGSETLAKVWALITATVACGKLYHPVQTMAQGTAQSPGAAISETK